jgi:hypothetical protein
MEKELSVTIKVHVNNSAILSSDDVQTLAH